MFLIFFLFWYFFDFLRWAFKAPEKFEHMRGNIDPISVFGFPVSFRHFVLPLTLWYRRTCFRSNIFYHISYKLWSISYPLGRVIPHILPPSPSFLLHRRKTRKSYDSSRSHKYWYIESSLTEEAQENYFLIKVK